MKTILILLFTLLASSQCGKSNSSDAGTVKISDVQLTPLKVPVFIGKSDVSLYTLKLRLDEDKKVILKKVILNFTPGSQPDCPNRNCGGKFHIVRGKPDFAQLYGEN